MSRQMWFAIIPKHHPESFNLQVLLLDEATSALDAESESQVPDFAAKQKNSDLARLIPG